MALQMINILTMKCTCDWN